MVGVSSYITNIGGSYIPNNYALNKAMNNAVNTAVKNALEQNAVVSPAKATTVNTAPDMQTFLSGLPFMQSQMQQFASNPGQNLQNRPVDVLRNSYMAAAQAPQLSQVVQQGAVPGGGPAPQPMQQSDVRARLAQLLGG